MTDQFDWMAWMSRTTANRLLSGKVNWMRYDHDLKVWVYLPTAWNGYRDRAPS